MVSTPPTSLNGSPKALREHHFTQNPLHYTQRLSRGLEQRLTDISDEDISDEERRLSLSITTGNLNKWTNMLHGWQERYFVLKDGVLSYFRNSDDVAEGCRGAIRLKNAQVQPHPYDDCRIDVILGDSTWYFRCPSAQSRRHWVECIEKHRLAESGYSSEQALTTQSSLLSLNSITSTSNAGSSNGFRGQSLHDQVAEIESFKTVLHQQTEKLLAYLEACNRIAAHANEVGGYENLLDAAVFEEARSQLPRDLRAVTTKFSTTTTTTPQPSFEESDEDLDDRCSLASDNSLGSLRISPPSLYTEGPPRGSCHSIPATVASASGPAAVSPDSGDEGAKTPKATTSNSTSSRGGGFFS
uniref:PH domain-containing protein n=1 Tax=Mesocestoides corti TaxID=53468 RepID=A0A5K3EQE9_MESCO